MQYVQALPREVDGELPARVLSDEPDKFSGITFDRGALLVCYGPAQAVHDRITLAVHHVFPIRAQRVICVCKSVRLTACSGAELVEVPLSERLLLGVLGKQHPKVSLGRGKFFPFGLGKRLCTETGWSQQECRICSESGTVCQKLLL